MSSAVWEKSESHDNSTILNTTRSEYLKVQNQNISNSQKLFCYNTNKWFKIKNIFQEKEYPEIQLSIFIDQPTPFITEALELVGGLDYPKSKINLFIYVDVSSTFIEHCWLFIY